MTRDSFKGNGSVAAPEKSFRRRIPKWALQSGDTSSSDQQYYAQRSTTPHRISSITRTLPRALSRATSERQFPATASSPPAAPPPAPASRSARSRSLISSTSRSPTSTAPRPPPTARTTTSPLPPAPRTTVHTRVASTTTSARKTRCGAKRIEANISPPQATTFITLPPAPSPIRSCPAAS